MEHCCKVGKNIDKYGLEHGVVGGDLNQYMLARWMGNNEYPETGLRPLTTWLNQKILKTVYTEHDRNTLDSRIESDHEALASDDDERRLAIIDDLESDGIDGEQLLDDFVSSTTLYRHFTNCLDEEKTRDIGEDDAAAEGVMERIQYSRNNTKGHIRENLKTLENRGKIPHATDADVSIPVILGCPVCSNQVQLERALERGYICDEHMSESATGPGESSSSISDDNEPQPESTLL
ncbi:rod-determining factor RdfA [Haloarcula sp. H-GB5]